jgi:hypothetical protein
MATDAQLHANRANAQYSTGPQTPAGIAASSQNNFRHGLASNFVVLPCEDHHAFADLLFALQEEYSPATETEDSLVTAMAQHEWLSMRALHLQQPLLEAPMETGAPVNEKQLSIYLRYQTTHNRAYHKALSQLLRIRADRRRAEIGFESQKARNELHEAKLRALEIRTKAGRVKLEQAQKDSKMKDELHTPKVKRAAALANVAELDFDRKRNHETPSSMSKTRFEHEKDAA